MNSIMKARDNKKLSTSQHQFVIGLIKMKKDKQFIKKN